MRYEPTLTMRRLLLASLLCPPLALAQQPPVPPAGEAGRIERQLQRLPEPTRPGDPIEVPSLPADAGTPSNAGQIRLTLKSLSVTGASTFSVDELLAPHRSLIGREVSMADVYAAAAEMTARYRDTGYILSSVIVPAQRIEDGTVRLQVIEGLIASVAVDGDVVRPGLIEAAREKLTSARPLRANQLERFLLLLNDLPGITAQGVLSPSATVPGGADLIVKTARQRASLSVGGTYRGSELQGPGQIETTAGINSLFGINDSTTLKYLQSQKAEELKLFGLTHTERLSAGGLDLTVSGSRSEGAPSLTGVLSRFNLENETTQGRLELSYPIVRTRATNLRLRSALTYHDGKTDIVGLPLYADTISAGRVGLTWDFIDALGGVTVFDAEYSKGLSVFDASELGSPTASRPGGDPKFSKVTWYVARLQSLGRGFSMLLAGTGQASSSNLLSSEEFAFGGEQFGRAYDPSELVGDEGLAGKVELRYTHDFTSGLGLTLYGFGESGRVKRTLFLPDELGAPEEDGASSLGLGLRFSFRGWLSGYVEAGEPTDQTVATTGEKKTRVFGGLLFTYRF